MNSKTYRFTGKQLCVFYEDSYDGPLEQIEKLLLLKLQNYQIFQYLILKKSCVNRVFAFVQLSTASSRFDTRRSDFFDMSLNDGKSERRILLKGHCEPCRSFQEFCINVGGAQENQDFVFIGSTDLMNEFMKKSENKYEPKLDLQQNQAHKQNEPEHPQLKPVRNQSQSQSQSQIPIQIQIQLENEAIAERVDKKFALEEECYRFLNLEQPGNYPKFWSIEQSTYYTDSDTQPPSHNGSLSSNSERLYKEKIASLEQENLQMSVENQELKVTVSRMEENFSRLLQMMNEKVNLMGEKMQKLEVENQGLKEQMQKHMMMQNYSSK